MRDIDYDEVLSRISAIYNSSSVAEQKMLRTVMQELAATGYSYTYEQLYLSDFREVPVSIDQFLCDPDYLGGATNGGKSVYPYWRSMMNDVFTLGNLYNEIILSGATRIGKTSTAVTILAYMLYKLMLYRDPHTYFNKKPTARFTLIFANLTKELANGVAFFEFNSTIKESPWFMRHGAMNKSVNNPIYLPEGDKINILPCSDAAHALGMQVWACLTGDTEILTVDGPKTLEECAGTEQRIIQYTDNHVLVETKAIIVLTKYAQDLRKVKLSNGFYIEGTPDHRIKVADETYKQLDELCCSTKILALDLTDDYVGPTRTLCVESIVCTHYVQPIPVYDVINAAPDHSFIVVNKHSAIVAHNCLMDEVSFAKAGIKDISKAKATMKNLYDVVNARISGTFRVGGEVYGKLIASSSKNQDNDFLSEHIETQQKAGNDHLYLVDEPQWKILPKRMFSDKTFHFTVGDRYKRGFVIPEEDDDEAHRDEYLKQGYQVIEAPAELRKNFLADYDIALRDIAGISVAGAMGFITQESITPCVSQERCNPFFEDILTIGKDDDLEICDFFHLDCVPQELKYQQLNIHLDLAETHNRTGIVGSCVAGNKIIETDEGKKVALPFIKEVFATAIEAPRGGRMSFQKVVNFIVWLRQNYFNIGTITADKFQSSFLLEVLTQQNFTAKGLSPGMNEFIGLRNLIVDQRIELVRCMLQEDELIKTQRMNNKIYHPEDEGGGHGDIAEALAGCTASLIAEQVTARPPAKNLVGIAAAVNTGRGRNTPMSSVNTISSTNSAQKKYPNRFPKLR